MMTTHTLADEEDRVTHSPIPVLRMHAAFTSRQNSIHEFGRETHMGASPCAPANQHGWIWRRVHQKGKGRKPVHASIHLRRTHARVEIHQAAHQEAWIEGLQDDQPLLPSSHLHGLAYGRVSKDIERLELNITRTKHLRPA